MVELGRYDPSLTLVQTTVVHDIPIVESNWIEYFINRNESKLNIHKKKNSFTFPVPILVRKFLVHGLDIHIVNHSLAYVHELVQWLRDLVPDLYYYNTNLCGLVQNHENVATSEHYGVWNDESEIFMIKRKCYQRSFSYFSFNLHVLD